MNEADAKRLATEISERLGSVLQNIPLEMLGKDPFTLRTIFHLGYLAALTVREAFPEVHDEFPIQMKLMAAFCAAREDNSKLANLFYEGLLKSNEDPELLRLDLDTIVSGKIREGVRHEIMASIDKAFPAGPRGRARKVFPSEPAMLIERSERLILLFALLLQLRARTNQHGWVQLLNAAETLRPDLKWQSDYLRTRMPAFEKLVSESTKLKTCKRETTRARMLADTLAAVDLNIKADYAIQRADEARRTQKRQTEKANGAQEKLAENSEFST